VRALFILAFWLFLGVIQPVHAGTMEGKCLEQTKASFDNKTIEGWTLKCNKGVWTTVGEGADTADANGYVEMYVYEGKSAGARTELKFRPRRSSECLIGIDDANRQLAKTVASHACDTDYKTGVAMSVARDASGWSRVAGAVRTSSKQHAFNAMYMQGLSLGIPNDTDYYLVAAFIEAR
jgi:hypothetical protein